MSSDTFLASDIDGIMRRVYFPLTHIGAGVIIDAAGNIFDSQDI